MKYTHENYVIEGVKYSTLEAIAEAYRENGVTKYGLQKAHQRGKIGDDLIPPQKRKNYIPPESTEGNFFMVSGHKFKSQKDACRKQNIKYGTFRKRKNRGWSDEEALGFDAKGRGINYKTTSNDKSTNSKRRGKKTIVNGKEFQSIIEATSFHGKNIDTVRTRLHNGASIEQALDLELYLTPTSIEYKGKFYPNKRVLAIELELKPSQLYRISKESNFGQAIEELLHKPVERGKRNETFYLNRPELAGLKGFIYFCVYNHPTIKPDTGKSFYKVGITENIKKRSTALKYVDEWWFQETTNLNSSRAESAVLEVFAAKLTNKLSPKDVDGKGEIFELREDEANEIKSYIVIDLLIQSRPKEFRQSYSKKGNLDN